MAFYKTNFVSNFNFFPLSWHFWNKGNTSKLEKIHESTLRFTYEDYECTYDELLEKAKVPYLKVRRMSTMAIECFKILSKLSPSCLHDLVVFKDCKYNFRYFNIVDIPRVPTSTSLKNSFKYTAVFYGMTYLMILEKFPILISLRIFLNLGMEMYVNIQFVLTFKFV